METSNDFNHDSLERDHDEPYIPEQEDEFDAELDDEDDIDDEYDGQPDEAQEWHDFDPDC